MGVLRITKSLLNSGVLASICSRDVKTFAYVHQPGTARILAK